MVSPKKSAMSLRDIGNGNRFASAPLRPALARHLTMNSNELFFGRAASEQQHMIPGGVGFLQRGFPRFLHRREVHRRQGQFEDSDIAICSLPWIGESRPSPL
jgi:hypothetical protein